MQNTAHVLTQGMGTVRVGMPHLTLLQCCADVMRRLNNGADWWCHSAPVSSPASGNLRVQSKLLRKLLQVNSEIAISLMSQVV
jgi:hypothetical protein